MFTSRSRQSNKRKLVGGIVAVIFVYLLLFARYQTYEIQEVVRNVKPETVWDYVADFSKMKSLNPSILDFKIVSDESDKGDWKYTVEYTEKLTYWPYWENRATGNYHVRKVAKGPKFLYLIESSHKTCFFGLYCVKTTGEFQISEANNGDTLCTEIVKYQCPPFMGAFCRREVEYQRRKIMYNLVYHFSQQQKN